MYTHAQRSFLGSFNFSQWKTGERNPFCSLFSAIFKFNLRFSISLWSANKTIFHCFKGWKPLPQQSTKIQLTWTMYSTLQGIIFNSVKKQFPRTHLTLPRSRIRSLLYPPLCHKWVSVWTWTLNWNKYNSLIKLDFMILIGSNKATEKG